MSGPIRPEPAENWLEGYTQHLAPADQTRTPNVAKALRAPSGRSVGPALPGNRPLPEGRRKPTKLERAMDFIADGLPVLGEIRGVAGGHELAQQGHPVGGALAAAMALVPFGGRIAKAAARTAFKEVEPAAFHSALQEFAKARPSEAGYITWRTPEEMTAEKMRTFLSPDGKTGYAVHPESGDIRNVFNHGAPGAGAHAVAEALTPERGGKILDAFDSGLGNFYRDMGFRETERFPWNNEYRPAGWDEAKHGTPDVVMMQHPRAGTASADEFLTQYEAARAARKAEPQVIHQGAGAGDPDALPIRTLGDSVVAKGIVGPDGSGAISTKTGRKLTVQRIQSGIEGPVYSVFDGDNKVAHARLSLGGRHIVEVETAEPFRRQGIASALYDHIERHTGRKLEPSPVLQSPDAQALWEHRLSSGAALGDSVAVRAAAPVIHRAPAPAATPTVGIPGQKDLPRYVGKRIPLSRLDDVQDETLRTYLNPEFEKLTSEGNFGNWYDTRPTEQLAIDALGDEEGTAGFRRLMEMIGATTARSDPANNLRRAGYYRALEKEGSLGVEGLKTGEYKSVPAGMGHLANDAHHSALARLLETGIIDPETNPKPASFVQNLERNFRPYTHDTRMATGAAQINPRLVDMGAIVKSVAKDKKTGKLTTTFSPRDWAYAPTERAAQQAAHTYASRGMLEVPAGADPTAFWQAKVWDALSSMLPGASPSQGTFNEVFNAKLAANAKKWGVSPVEANRLFWGGRPFDLPLNADLRPKGLLGR